MLTAVALTWGPTPTNGTLAQTNGLTPGVTQARPGIRAAPAFAAQALFARFGAFFRAAALGAYPNTGFWGLAGCGATGWAVAFCRLDRANVAAPCYT